MSKLFRILTVVLMTSVLLAANVAMAGPGGKDETGDPDSPQVTHPTKSGHQSAADSYRTGTSDQGRTVVIEARDRWIRWLKAYLRAVRAWSI